MFPPAAEAVAAPLSLGLAALSTGVSTAVAWATHTCLGSSAEAVATNSIIVCLAAIQCHQDDYPCSSVHHHPSWFSEDDIAPDASQSTPPNYA